MKDLTRVFTWFMVVTTSVLCLIGIVLVMMNRSLYDFYSALFFPLLDEGFVLQVVTFGGVVAFLTISYIIIVYKSANKAQVRLVYASIGLLVAIAFVFPEYKNHQEKLAVKDVCRRFDLALARSDYGAAYEFMSPDYRQTHSLAQFIEVDRRPLTCQHPDKRVRVVLLYPKAGEASIVHTPFGSLITVIPLEQVDDKWYFTGEVRLLQG